MPRADKLRQMADALTPKIEEKRNPAVVQQNYTGRRARIASSMWQDADHMERIQYALYGLADAHEAGTLHPLLAKVTTKTLIEALLYHDGWPPDNDWYAADIKRLRKAGLSPGTYDKAHAAFMQLVNPPDREGERLRRELEQKARDLVGQIPGYFPTPPDVIDQMIALAHLPSGPITLLEPSAGAGHIADKLRALDSQYEIQVIEWAIPLRELLKVKGYELVGDDFLEFIPGSGGYPYILMNPPFENFQDIDHVWHAYACLSMTGRLVSVMSEGVFFRSDSKAVEFREWLDSVGGWDVDLPAGAFKSSGTNIKARLVVIDRC